jgi:hypothetical protein
MPLGLVVRSLDSSYPTNAASAVTQLMNSVERHETQRLKSCATKQGIIAMVARFRTNMAASRSNRAERLHSRALVQLFHRRLGNAG